MGTQDMVRNKRWLLLGAGIAFLWSFLLVPRIFAHGTSIELTVAEQTIHMHALFDTGEPMGAAQIVVYAADNPRQAWLTGVADSAGNYSFPVDTRIAGQWAISVRTAGHGEILHFTVTPSGVIDVTQGGGRSPLQTTLLAGGVVVVLGGVAWFYSRPKKSAS